MLQFEIVQGSLKVTNGSVVVLLMSKQDAGANVLALQGDVPKVEIYNLNLGFTSLVLNQPLSQCADDTGTPFTVDSFILFAEENLGFNGGGTPLPSVTSVGLIMPIAFDVANSPITSSGDILVTGAGTASQYIRGDGNLASFPDISGGGGGQVYYANGGTSEGTIGGDAFYQLSVSAVIGSPADFTSGTVDDVVFANFITDIGKPTQEIIPAGVWIFQCYLSASATANCEVYATVEVYDGSTFTVLATSVSETITNGTAIDLYTFTCAVPEYSPLIPADRIAIRFYPSNLSGNTITLHTQGDHLSSIQTTFSTGISALNGLTATAQYFATSTSGTNFSITSLSNTHTFNLPTSSALNTGALSSADWTSFNGKGTVTSVSAITLGATGTDLNSTVANGTTTPVITLNVPDASATARGVITTGTQTIAGAKTFSSQISMPATGSQLILSVSSGGTISGLNLASYPSPLELTSLKGISFVPIQTQLNAKANTGSWTDYSATSTLMGFSSTFSKTIYYIIISDTMFVVFNISGTSNATTLTFTLPNNSSLVNISTSGGSAINNSITATSPPRITNVVGLNIINVYSTLASGAWTASGTKGASGQFFIKI